MSETKLFDTDERSGINLLNSDNARFERTSGGFANLETGGKRFERVVILRAFPLSDPDLYISVRESGDKMKEIGMIKSIADLSPADAEIVREQLSLRYFTPKIKKVLSAKDKHGFSTLDVITDKGRCKFTFRTGSDSVIRLSETRLVFCDIDSSRYEIEDILSLSKSEQKKLDLYI